MTTKAYQESSTGKKHAHRYNGIHKWVISPESVLTHPLNCEVLRACECGRTRKGAPTYEEIVEYVKAHTCECGNIGHDHKAPTDCISNLRAKIEILEDRIDRMSQAFRNIGKAVE